jgi:putative glycosyltransferase (TIGR04372 family)
MKLVFCWEFILNALKKCVKMVILIFSIVLLLLLRVLKPILRVGIVVVGSHKYGHLALEPDLMLLKLDEERQNRTRKIPVRISIWSLGPKRFRANKVLANLWKPRLIVFPSWLVSSLLNGGERFSSLSLERRDTSIYWPANKQKLSPSPTSLSPNQLRKGRSGLASIGIDPTRPFVCLIVRDSGHYSDSLGRENPAYGFRNHDIDDFSDSIRSLIKRGYQVVRMGAGKEIPISFACDGLVDYATSGFRNELLDVYLAANCEFAISTQTGPDAVCQLFRRPVCFIDVPIIGQFFIGSGLCTWNPLIYEKEGVAIPLQKMIELNLAWQNPLEELEKNLIHPIRSTHKEIESYVLGYTDFLEAGFRLSAIDLELSEIANLTLQKNLDTLGGGLFGEVKAILNPTFLRSNADWYLA